MLCNKCEKEIEQTDDGGLRAQSKSAATPERSITKIDKTHLLPALYLFFIGGGFIAVELCSHDGPLRVHSLIVIACGVLLMIAGVLSTICALLDKPMEESLDLSPNAKGSSLCFQCFIGSFYILTIASPVAVITILLAQLFGW